MNRNNKQARGFELSDWYGDQAHGSAPGHMQALGAAAMPGLAIPVFMSERESQRLKRFAAEAEVTEILDGIDKIIDTLPNRQIAAHLGTKIVETTLFAQNVAENAAVVEAERLLREADSVTQPA